MQVVQGLTVIEFTVGNHTGSGIHCLPFPNDHNFIPPSSHLLAAIFRCFFPSAQPDDPSPTSLFHALFLLHCMPMIFVICNHNPWYLTASPFSLLLWNRWEETRTEKKKQTHKNKPLLSSNAWHNCKLQPQAGDRQEKSSSSLVLGLGVMVPRRAADAKGHVSTELPWLCWAEGNTILFSQLRSYLGFGEFSLQGEKEKEGASG